MDRRDINDKHLADKALAISKVLTYAEGVMAGWTPDRVEHDLRFALKALATKPEAKHTYGKISVHRQAGCSYGFDVQINLGAFLFFDESED